MSEFERRRGASSSYLVRLWQEPGEESARESSARVYVRNLRSGEERYLKSPDQLADYFREDPADQRSVAEPDVGRRQAG